MFGQELERIRMPARDVFLHDFIHPHRPAIITNLFDGEAIRQVTTLREATDAFGGAMLPIRPEYTRPQSAASPRPMSFGDYWHLVRSDPATVLMCAEAEVPARVLSLFTLPQACRAESMLPDEILSLPRRYGDHDLVLNVFVGNRGNVAHLHYDGDQREVLLYQVFGVKEVILFAPDRGIALEPLNSLVFSGISLQSMSPADRRAFVQESGGYWGELHPGDAVYIPLLFWHFLYYAEDSMSFNIRFGRNRYNRFLSVDNCHRDYYLQNLAIHFRDASLGDGRYACAFDEIVAEYLRPESSLAEKVRRMRDLFRRLCRSYCAQARTDEYCPPEREPAELAKLIDFVQNTMRYADPAIVARSLPVGPITGEQLRHIRELTRKHGYSDVLLHKVVHNRIGKETLQTLTRAEASQFLTYLRSPAALH